MSIKKKIWFSVLILLVILILSVIVYVVIMFSRIQYTPLHASPSASAAAVVPVAVPSASASPEELADSELSLADEMEQTQLTEQELARLQAHAQGNEVVNVLLVGIDRRAKGSDDYLGNSDTLLIGTLDQPNQRLKLTSLMRDLYVKIPGRGENRINSALSRGGMPLLLDTINSNFNTELAYYVMIDFYMFETAVDELGGITVELSKGEIAEANDCIAGLNKQRGASRRDGFITDRQGGTLTLTGKQALGYCRMRHFGDGDFARTSRQAKALQAILDKFMAAGPIKQSSLLYQLLPMVETNLSPTQIASLATKVLAVAKQKEIMHYRLPVEGEYAARRVRGMYVLVPDISANAQNLHWFLYEATQIDPLPSSDTGKGSYHRIKEPRTTTIYVTPAPASASATPLPAETETATPSASAAPVDAVDTPLPASPEDTGSALEPTAPTEPPQPAEQAEQPAENSAPEPDLPALAPADDDSAPANDAPPPADDSSSVTVDENAA